MTPQKPKAAMPEMSAERSCFAAGVSDKLIAG
jgi:hypothetical protein